MTNVIRTPHGLLDLAAVDAWNRANAEAAHEYQTLPIAHTTGELVAPCIRRCGRNARGSRGICRDCTRRSNP